MKIQPYIFLCFLFAGALFARPEADIADSLFYQKIKDNKNYKIDKSGLLIWQKNLIETEWTHSIYKNAFVPRVLLKLIFQHQKDSSRFVAKIYEFPNETDAFGLYSLERVPSLEFNATGFESYFWQNKMITWYGKYLLVIKKNGRLTEPDEDFREIAQIILNLLPRQKNELHFLSALPEKNRVRYSEKLIPFRWLGQPYFENTFYADYKTDEGYCRIFIINNGTTSRADSNYWRYYEFIQKNAILLQGQLKIRTDYYLVNDPLWGKIILAKKNQIIYGILDYKDFGWTEDRMEDILNYLRKNKIVKSG